MNLLVKIDLSGAEIDVFEAYETKVLALLNDHAAALEFRVRTKDGQSEFHLLRFPDEAALAAYRANPVRVALQAEWVRSGAQSEIVEVVHIV